MTTLQRSAISFRRQGSSGRIWSDQFISDPKNRAIHQNQEETCQQSGKNSNDLEDNIRIQKSSSSSSSSSSSPSLYSTKICREQNIPSSIRSKLGCGLSSFFRQCIGSPTHA